MYFEKRHLSIFMLLFAFLISNGINMFYDYYTHDQPQMNGSEAGFLQRLREQDRCKRIKYEGKRLTVLWA